jgi:undecaprenyl-diphosphatase
MMTLTALDEAVRAALHARSSPALTAVMLWLTHLGAERVLVPLGAAAALWLARESRRAAWLFVAVLLGGELLSEGLKLLFHRPRPHPFFGVAEPFTYSFPSGHAFMSVCFYGLLALYAAPRLRTHAARVILWIAVAAIAAVVGFSRVYLGVHYLSDVIGGYALGVAWIAVWRRRAAAHATMLAGH